MNDSIVTQSCVTCGNAGAAMKCGGCKERWYCNKCCAKVDWKSGHRETCAAGGGGAGGGSQTDRAASVKIDPIDLPPISRPVPSGQACPHCLDEDDDVFVLGCGCRGSAGGAHVVCMVEWAVKAREIDPNRGPCTFQVCTTCHRSFHGAFSLLMVQAALRHYRAKHNHHKPRNEIFLLYYEISLASLLRGEYPLQAEVLARRTLARAKKSFPKAELLHGNCGSDLMMALDSNGKTKAAIRYGRKLLADLRKRFGASSSIVANVKAKFARVLVGDGSELSTKRFEAMRLAKSTRLAEAITLLESSLRVIEGGLQPLSPQDANRVERTKRRLSLYLLHHRADNGDAMKMYKDALQTLKRTFGLNHYITLQMEKDYIFWVLQTFRHSELPNGNQAQPQTSEVPLRLLFDRYKLNFPFDHRGRLHCAILLSDTLMEAEKYEEAISLLHETAEVLKKEPFYLFREHRGSQDPLLVLCRIGMERFNERFAQREAELQFERGLKIVSVVGALACVAVFISALRNR